MKKLFAKAVFLTTVAVSVVPSTFAFADQTGIPTNVSVSVPTGLIPGGVWTLIGSIFGLIAIAGVLYALFNFVREHFSNRGTGALRHVLGGLLVAAICFGAFGFIHFIVQAGQTAGNDLTGTTTTTSTGGTSGS